VTIDDLDPTGHLYPCPCCGYLTSSEPGSNDICPICGWEDDLSQLRFAAMAGGANHVSLIEAQHNYIETGSSDPAALAAGRITVRRPAGEVRDPGFRLLAASDIEPVTYEVDQGSTYPSDPTALYYWRSPRASSPLDHSAGAG
jgi:cysteine-rich CPCC protein